MLPAFDMPPNECFSVKWAVKKNTCIELKYKIDLFIFCLKKKPCSDLTDDRRCCCCCGSRSCCCCCCCSALRTKRCHIDLKGRERLKKTSVKGTVAHGTGRRAQPVLELPDVLLLSTLVLMGMGTMLLSDTPGELFPLNRRFTSSSSVPAKRMR